MRARRNEPRPLKAHPATSWFERLGASNLELTDLARLTDRSVASVRTSVLKSTAGLPHGVIAVITAWELMNDAQRAKWLAAVERETD